MGTEQSGVSATTAQPAVSRVRWRTVARVVCPIAALMILAAALHAVDEWLPHFPREPGRRLTEFFLRSVLIGYAAVLIAVPLLLIASAWLLLRSRSNGLRADAVARVALLCGSAAIAVVGLELAAAAWLAWVHRFPTLPTKFPVAPGRDELSLVVIGGSSALGYPYDSALSVGHIVAWQLEEAAPGRRVVLDIRAQLGKNLEDMHTRMAELRRRPDALIIFSGHNEFLSRFDAARDAGDAETPHEELLHALYQLSLHSPFCIWVYETVRKHRLGGPPPAMNQHSLIDAPSFTPSELIELLRDFRSRLEAIVTYCERIGAVPILVIPPSNESGFEPNRTVLPARVSASRRAELADRFFQARSLEQESGDESMAMYRSIVTEEPEFAEAHFRLGRLFERAGKFDLARDHFIRARDLDGWPVRCRGDFAQTYQDVAARHPCILVDGPEVLRKLSQHAILDDELFHDAHHPTFKGHLGLAQAIMDGLYKHKMLGLNGPMASAPTIDPARCAAHFQVDDRVWGGACVKTGTYYKHLASARYDQTERKAKEARFMQATEDILSGRIRPDQAGVPGIGLASSVSDMDDWWVKGPAIVRTRNPPPG
jgi:hypothetical protein